MDIADTNDEYSFFSFFLFLKHAHVQTHMYACMHRGTLTHTHTHHTFINYNKLKLHRMKS